MRNIITLLVFSAFIGCNSQDKASSKIRNENPIIEKQIKLTGKEIVEELERLNFFNLTDESELSEVKADFEKSYTELNFFQGKLRGESLDFMDNRYYWIDCEELFEIGGLTEYLTQVQRTFKKLNLDLKFENEKSIQDENKWKHTIELNGNEYIAFDGQFSDLDWGIAYVNFIEMLNTELIRQGTNEQFYPIDCGNDGSFVLLTLEQYNFVLQNYPIDNEHPTTLSNWKSKNGL